MTIPSEYKEAGRIAAEVRETVRHKELCGRTFLEICNFVEDMIISKGGQPAFPCNICVNSTAAHYTAEIGDENIVDERDVVKVDIGVHLDGYIADTAVTVTNELEFDRLVEATEATLNEGVRAVHRDIGVEDIGDVISTVASRWGFRPITNLSGHLIERYTIHAGKSIPNFRAPRSSRVRIGEVYAVEPFLTDTNASGTVISSSTVNIYSISTLKRTGEKELDDFMNTIWEKCRTLPFAMRYFSQLYKKKKLDEMIQKLMKKKVVRGYPVLIEEKGGVVAQAEHTITTTETGLVILTRI